MASKGPVKNKISYKSAELFAQSFEKGMQDLFGALGADRNHYLAVNLTGQAESLFLFESEFHLIAMPERKEKGRLFIASLPEKPVIVRVTAENAKWLDLFGKVLIGCLHPELTPLESEKLYLKLLALPEREKGITLGGRVCRIERAEEKTDAKENYMELCEKASDDKIRDRVREKLPEFRAEDFDFVQIMGTGIEQAFLDSVPDVTYRGNKKSGDCLYTISRSVRLITKDRMVTGVRIEDAANFQVLTIHYGEDEKSAVEKLTRYLVHPEKIPGRGGYRAYSYRGDTDFHDHVYVMTVDIFAGCVSGITLMKQI